MIHAVVLDCVCDIGLSQVQHASDADPVSRRENGLSVKMVWRRHFLAETDSRRHAGKLPLAGRWRPERNDAARDGRRRPAPIEDAAPAPAERAKGRRCNVAELPGLPDPEQEGLRFLISSCVRGVRPRPGSRTRERPEKIISPNLSRNPLKRFDSDERIQGNPSFSNRVLRAVQPPNRGSQGKPNAERGPGTRSAARPQGPSASCPASRPPGSAVSRRRWELKRDGTP
jgi:hypothetical protein